MAGSGFENEIVFAENGDLTGASIPDEANGLTSDNEIWMGRSSVVVNRSQIDVMRLVAGTGISFLAAGRGGPAGVPGTFTINSTGAMTDLHTARFIVSAGGAADGANFTDIASAIAAAVIVGAPQTIFVQTGVYVENITLPAGINLTAFQSDSLGGDVEIVGTITSTDAGTRDISGIRLSTNAAASISVTGAAATIVNLINCNFNATNANAIVGTSSGGAIIQLYQCTGTVTGANSLFTLTTGSSINTFYTRVVGTTTASTAGTGCNLALNFSQFNFPITTSGTAIFGMTLTTISSTVTTINCGSTGSHIFRNSSIGGPGNVAAIDIAVNCHVVCTDCSLVSNQADVITGAGEFEFAACTFVGNGTNIASTLQSTRVGSNTPAKVTIPGAYPYLVKAQDYFIPVDTGSARTISLPATPQTGEEHVIKDNTGTAAANNITVSGNGNNIDGAATKLINTNFGAVTFTFNGTQYNAW